MKRIKQKDEIYVRGGFVFGVYFFLIAILMLFLWPGTWSWDDLHMLYDIRTYTSLRPWQHILSGYFLDILFQIFPFEGGVILLQNIMISVCVAYAITKLEVIFNIRRLESKYLDIGIKLIPFLAPPVLMYQFSGYRMGPYIYLELVMIVMLLGLLKENKVWGKTYLAFFCFLAVIVSSWRTESFLYIPCICVCVVWTKKCVLTSRKKIVCVLLLLVGFFGMNRMQSDALGSSNYEVISLLRPCVEVVHVADINEDAELLKAIDSVISVELILDNPGKSGEALYWSGAVPVDYTEEEYSSFLKAFL